MSSNDFKKNPLWVIKGKTISKLIAELQTFQNQDIEVRISLDDGLTSKPISMVTRRGNICILVNSED
jgi:hypothetical protein